MGKKNNYELMPNDIRNGVTVPNKRKFNFACCDCGLVHQVVICAPKTKQDVELGLAMRKNNSATFHRRRETGRTFRVVRVKNTAKRGLLNG